MPPPDRVLLNVGGTHFEVARSTLLWPSSESNFFRSLLSGQHTVKVDAKDGAIFIDRAPRVFDTILQFLRTKTISLSGDVTVEEIRQEAEYYGLSDVLFSTCGTLPPCKRVFVVKECFKTAIKEVKDHKQDHVDLAAAIKHVAVCPNDGHKIHTYSSGAYSTDASGHIVLVTRPHRHYRLTAVSHGTKWNRVPIILLAGFTYDDTEPAQGNQFVVADFRMPVSFKENLLPITFPYMAKEYHQVCYWHIYVRFAWAGCYEKAITVTFEMDCIHTFDDTQEVLCE
ncbi:BTB/POZ domain-containing protein kctd3 [Sorochytrium milnesiophthora]